MVAVVDSGIDLTHKDLYLNIWINQDELPRVVTDRKGEIDIDADGQITFYDLNYPANRCGDEGPLDAGCLADVNSNGYIDADDLLQRMVRRGPR